MFKKSKNKSYYKRGQSLLAKIRAVNRGMSLMYEELESHGYVDHDTKALYIKGQELISESLSFGDSYLAHEKQRDAALQKMEEDLRVIRGLLEAKE